jgi:alpha-mannosidase
MSGAQVAYDVPFGVVRVGKDEAVGSEAADYVPADQEHPRDVQDWINASDASLGVTLSSSAVECDFVDPTADPLAEPVLQSLLLGTRRSGCGEGVVYTQAGDHDFQFSITSGEPGWERGYRFGSQARNPLIAVVVEKNNGKADLPEQMSFCSVDAPNVIISAVKKCDDDESVIVRCYDNAGRDTDATITVGFPVARAERTNIIEEDGKPTVSRPNGVTLKVGHHAIETVKLMPQTSSKAAKAN